MFLFKNLGRLHTQKKEKEKEKEKKKEKEKEKEKENLCVVFTYAIKWAREFPVVVVQRRQRNVQNSAMHVQSCCLLI